MGDFKKVWDTAGYYKKAKEGSLYLDHPGMEIIRKLAKDKDSILDLGCGEGTRLSILAEGKVGVGVDISKTAIETAKKSYPKFKFEVSNIEQTPFDTCSFDLVYSAFVLEHVDNPEKVLAEGIRLVKKGGYLALVAPNYGAPNHSSPPFSGSRIKKLMKGFTNDFKRLFFYRGLQWNKVIPITAKTFEIDFDTTVEPYLGSLIKFLKFKNLKIEKALSCWSEESRTAGKTQKVFGFLGRLGIYPFWMWGPHLVIVAKKSN